MHFGRIWTLRGPNRWATVPVIETDLNRDDGETADPGPVADAVLAATREFQRGTGFSGTIAFVTAVSPDKSRLVFDYDDAAVAHACLDAGFARVVAAAKLAELQAIARESRPDPVTTAVLAAAAQRGIPARRLPDEPVVLLGWGAKQHRIPAGEPADPDILFPAGSTGRIPVAAVTGTNGKTTTTRLLARILGETGKFVGMTCTDGIYLAGRRTDTHDCSGPQSARQVLADPRVEVAVLETARGGILREGLGFDRCDVAVVTNLGKGDHLGLRGVDTLDQLAAVKRVVPAATAPTGTAVLNAADPHVAAMAAAVPGRVLFFARDEFAPTLAAHRAAGGLAAFTRGGVLVVADGASETVVVPLAEVTFTRGGEVPFQVENALAAAAAAWRLGVPPETIAAGLRAFGRAAGEVPGRFNVLDAGGATVVVDYAHNPSAVAALVAGLDAFPHPRRTLVFAGCNRRDEDLVDMGRSAGDAFDDVILYADAGNADRTDGELNGLLKRGLAAGARVQRVTEEPTERAALERVLAGLRPGDLVVLGVEAIEESLAFVEERLGGSSTPAG